MVIAKLIRQYRRSINPPYSRKDALTILATLLILIAVPLTVLAVKIARSPNGKAATASGIELGVDAFTEHLASEPSGLTYVYKYITGQGWQSYVASYMSTAYSHGFKPVFVYYTSYDDPYSIDFVGWDQLMSTIRSDGRDAWVVIEPDLAGYLKNNNECSTTLKTDMNRFLSTKASNAHLGYMMSPWMVPYDGATADAQAQKTCWLAAGGDRLEDIYVDVSDRDQQYKGTYPWSSTQLTEFEDWFSALHTATGRKIGVWQIPMGNSTCNNGFRSNFVETWLTTSKLTQLSSSVNKLLFGPGVEFFNGSEPGQTWNLPVDEQYDCGFFNGKVTELSSPGGDTQSPTLSITAPSSGSTVSGSSVPVTATANDNVGVTRVEFYYDSTNLIGTDTTSSYSVNWNTTALSNGSHRLLAKAYDAAGNVGSSLTVSVTVNNTPSTKTADLNNDNQVNGADLKILVDNWGLTSGVADINKDNIVNVFDLSILLTNWGS